MKKAYLSPLFFLLAFLMACTDPLENALDTPSAEAAQKAVSPEDCSSSTTPGSILLGVYYGNQGWAMSDVAAMESWQNKKNAVINLFTNWCNRSKTIDDLFKLQLMHIWNNKNVPLITWEPNTCSGTPTDIEARIARGEHDAYIHTWSNRLKGSLSGPDGVYGNADDRRVYLRLGHEMNGNWYAWSAAVGNNSPEDYKAMWKHVKGIFDGKGLDPAHVQWVWCVNHTDNGGFTAEQYYPGDGFVDWVAIDGYNWGTSQSWSSWATPSQTFDPMLGRLRNLTSKPVALTEFASTTSNLGVSGKSTWIRDVFRYVESNNIKMVTWFNEDKETDWAIFGGVNGDETIKRKKAYSAYRTAIGSSRYLSSDPANARLLSDCLFKGQ
ncbi:hypothetical protein BH24BAC1_BH24BAC1_06590 [soil metagenome]